jgi:hypothetical protein
MLLPFISDDIPTGIREFNATIDPAGMSPYRWQDPPQYGPNRPVH